MKTEFHIDRNRKLTKAQDYAFLREEGLKYLESMAHELWTDYNAHDPGMTMLEVLCYAITELGYRANFKINDLLTNADGQIENGTFFPAREILTNAPLTVLDYRKLLIDVVGVNNAWIIYHQSALDPLGYSLPLENEVAVYVNKKEDKLSLSPQDKFGNTLQRLPIRGLNKIIVELSEDIVLGQLNEISIEHSWFEGDRFVEVEISTDFDSWNHSNAELFGQLNSESDIEFVNVGKEGSVLKIEVRLKADNQKTLLLIAKPRDPAELELTLNYYSDLKNVSSAIETFRLKKEKVDAIYVQIGDRLEQNRNLTEDWLCLETIDNIEIGICADISIETEADAEQMMAMAEQAIDLILNPPVRFYTLRQLLDMEIGPREIFNGPSLEHGFLFDEEVVASQLPECIHASDIIAALMAIDGIRAVDNLLLTAYDKNGKPIAEKSNRQWCLDLSGEKKPVFDPNRSKMLLFRDGIPFLIPEKGGIELNEGVFYLKTENNIFKLQKPQNDFELPVGKHYQLDEYYSIQNDFPMTYGIGPGQLRDSVPSLRKAQAKQLKAYLLHFDQLIADFFGQLYDAKNLLDIGDIKRTYTPQYLMEITGIDEDFLWKEVYPTNFDTTLLNGSNPEDRSLFESGKMFYERRNRFLDHLLARFGESFNDYVFMMFSMQENAKGLAEMTIQEDELLDDKRRFLAKYPEISYSRGLGLDYCQRASTESEHPWKIGNRGGYEKRIAALLGINNIPLMDIADNVPKDTWSYETSLGKLTFSLQNFVPLPLDEKWELGQRLLNNASAYRVFTFTKSYIFAVNKDHKRIVKFEKEFITPEEAEEYIPKLYQALNSHLENFYCLEHILLRPLAGEDLTDDDLLTVCLNDDCYSEANDDPYSFKVTLVLPGWLARFRNRYFRRYAENLIRKEAPAHVLVKICWVGRDDMIPFQEVYKDWIFAYRKLKVDYCDNTLGPNEMKNYNLALSNLMEQLKELNTIYDEGTLHDCLESELDNPISLNNSSLGTLQNIEP